MQLTMTGEYAVRAMVYLSSLPHGSVAQLSDIAREWDIPESFLRKIAAMLSRSGLLVSQRGSGGGVALGRPAHQISLLEVIEQVEGPMFLNKCLMGATSCARTEWCAVHDVWCKAQESIRDLLGSQSLAELAARSASRQPE